MSLARDFYDFAKEVNADLDTVVNDMAEQSKTQAAGRAETNELMTRVFERLGTVEELLGRVVPAVESFDRRLTLLQEAQVNTNRDLSYRVTRLESNGTHPAEEVTPPRPRPALPR